MDHLFFVRVMRPYSDGSFPHGQDGVLYWQWSLTGPHPKRECQRILAFTIGEILTYEEGMHVLAGAPYASIPEIDARLKAFRAKVTEEEAYQETLDEALLNTGWPTYDEVGYMQARSIMSRNEFDYSDFGNKGPEIEKAWEAFVIAMEEKGKHYSPKS